jgi:endo-1,4-beta-xylanase
LSDFSRREFVKLGAASAAELLLRWDRSGNALAVAAAATQEESVSTTLRQAAASRGVIYGAAVRGSSLEDERFERLLAEQCGILVPEGALKWHTLRPAPDRFDFRAGDQLLEYARTHNMKYRGHTLVWHEALPAWFEAHATVSNARTLMTTHIQTVVKHYAGKLHSWDVVNEIIEPNDGRPDGLKKSPWLSAIGPEYIDLAFQAAADADPKALLVWNENLLEGESDYSQAKRRHVLTLLTELKRRGTPVQALGLQGHLYGHLPVARGLRDFVARVADFGLKILVTELDVRDQRLPGDVATRDRMVAEKYLEFLSAVVPEKALIAVLSWGLSDRYTWLNDPGLPLGQRRRDGMPARPLPFDADLRRKPAFVAIQRAFDSSPAR